MDLLHRLKENPAAIFRLSSDSGIIDEINGITKSLLDPIAKDHSVLDEIYTEGLDSTQVWGQAQMIISNVGETYLFNEIPKLRETYGIKPEDSEGDEDEQDEESPTEDEHPKTDHVVESKKEDDDDEDDDEEEEEEEFYSFSDHGDNSDGVLSNDEDLSDVDSEKTKVQSDDEFAIPEKDAFGLNDGFFDIDKFNKQIMDLEDENNENDDEEVDLFADVSEGEDEDEQQDMDYYDEFFDKPGQNKSLNKFRETPTSDKDEDENQETGGELEDNEYEQAVDGAMLDLFAEADEDKPKSSKNLSSFEKQQQKLQAEISELEAELIAEKKWTMKGEVKSGDRPADSLLNDDEAPTLEFDRTSKPVPVITDEVTETIEDLIKRRIRNDEFDDLPRRLITDVGKFVQKKKTEVSDQKSAKSLAEIYEDEYHGVEPEDKLSEEVQAAHEEISDLFTKLNYKLDSLCSAHYIPKPNEFKSIEIKVSDAPASITMEDAQPLHVSDEVKLAPQEIYKIGDDKPKADGARGNSQVQLKSGLSYSKDELDREDKQRLRRAKKRAKSKHFNELKEIKEQREKEKPKDEKEGDRKRQRVGDVVDTLSKAKNLTVIDKKGQLRDAQGNLKKSSGAQTSNDFRL
ncbi:hypothetical protein JCM33374_g161 [Metschnikowia sp. JCM 33374]|nr:hypothetical protein JCM33374_g161 [Metschnikowia sp. JCM 33374]